MRVNCRSGVKAAPLCRKMYVSPIKSTSTTDLQFIFDKSKSYADVLITLGISPSSGSSEKVLRERVRKDSIDTTQFYKNQKENLSKIRKSSYIAHQPKYSLDEILVKDSHYTNISCLKRRIVKAGILEYKCSECGISNIYNGKPIVLQLEHKNGERLDHRKENLEFLCPNCHSQTETYCGKNTKRRKRG